MSEGIIDLTALLVGGGVTGVSETVEDTGTFSYPLYIPEVAGIRSIEWIRDEVRGVSESPFTLHRQIYRHTGERWKANVELPPMRREHAAQWAGFILSLFGGHGTFLFGDVFTPEPFGVAFGTPFVNGNNQTGSTLATGGWDVNVTDILKAGDRIQIGNSMHMVLRNANSDENGETILDIWPRLRVSPEENKTIVTSHPKGIFRLENSNASLLYNDISIASQVVAFSIVEVF